MADLHVFYKNHDVFLRLHTTLQKRLIPSQQDFLLFTLRTRGQLKQPLQVAEKQLLYTKNSRSRSRLFHACFDILLFLSVYFFKFLSF